LKIAFTTNGNSIEDSIEPAFGRCKNFLIVDSESGGASVVPNPGAASAGGAGVKAAETLAERGIGKLITGSIGFNSRPLLEAAGITIVTGKSGKIRAHLTASGNQPEEPQPRPAATMPRSEKPPVATSSRKPTGYCFCQRCGYQTDDDSGVPCFKLKCPNCASTMERKFN
jgi:predicted Fe-Mo cluster-binding NifX family protein